MELVDLVEPGMPAIVLPGKRDRKVNREEGYNVPYFPTAPKYAISESETKVNLKTMVKNEEAADTNSDTTRNEEDSISAPPVDPDSHHTEIADTLQGIF